MMPEEALVLITKAALIDPRLKRTDDTERADMAEAWADVLDDITLAEGLEALRSLQRTRGASEPAIQPADILALVASVTPSDDPMYVDYTDQIAIERWTQDALALGYNRGQLDDELTRIEIDRRLAAGELEAPRG